MSEEQEVYLAGNERNTELLFIAKRLVDFTKDFGKFDENKKK